MPRLVFLRWMNRSFLGRLTVCVGSIIALYFILRTSSVEIKSPTKNFIKSTGATSNATSALPGYPTRPEVRLWTLSPANSIIAAHNLKSSRAALIRSAGRNQTASKQVTLRSAIGALRTIREDRLMPLPHAIESSIHKRNIRTETLKKVDGKKITLRKTKHKPLSKKVPAPTRKPIQIEDVTRFLHLDKPGNDLINTLKFTFPLDSYVCQKSPSLVLILVHSAVRNARRRQVIRTTWAGVKSYRSLALATVFLVGLGTGGDQQVALETEAAQYGDLVQGPFLDTYHNLTYKHVMGLVWAWRHCPQATYVVKVDDDTLVNPYRLVTFLKDVGVPDRTIYGRLFNPSPQRIHGKWHVSVEEYPLHQYPTYCEGFAYVLRRSTCKLLVEAARTSKFFWIDDVYVTGLLRAKANVRLMNFKKDFGFEIFSILNRKPTTKKCIFYREANTMSNMYFRVWNSLYQ